VLGRSDEGSELRRCRVFTLSRRREEVGERGAKLTDLLGLSAVLAGVVDKRETVEEEGERGDVVVRRYCRPLWLPVPVDSHMGRGPLEVGWEDNLPDYMARMGSR